MKPSQLRSALCAGVMAIGTVWNLSASEVTMPMPEVSMPGLEPIIRSAIERSPRTMARDLELLNAQYGEMVSSSRLYPQVGGNYQFQFRAEDRGQVSGQDSGERNYYNLTVSQTLWHWGAVRAGARAGSIGTMIAERNLEGARRETALEVRNAYLGLIVQKIVVRNVRLNAKLAQEALAREQERLAANLVTAGAVAGAQLRTDEATLAADRAESDFAFSIEAFRRLTGVTDFTEADIPEQVAPPAEDPPPADPEESRGYLRSDALAVNQLQIDRAALEHLIDRKSLWPKLNAVAGVSQDDSIFLVSQNRRLQDRAAFVGFQVNWTIFDGFASKGRRLQSLNRQRQLEQSRDDLIASLKNSADQQAANVGFAWRTYRNAETRKRFATGRLNTEKANLERGLSSEDQVAQAEAALYQAELVANDALAKFYTAAARYASSMQADPIIDGAPSP